MSFRAARARFQFDFRFDPKKGLIRRVVSQRNAGKRAEGGALTGVHGLEHAGNELVDAI